MFPSSFSAILMITKRNANTVLLSSKTHSCIAKLNLKQSSRLQLFCLQHCKKKFPVHYFLQIFWWVLFWALVSSCFWKRLYNKTCLSQIMKASNDQKHRSLKFYRRDVKKKSESLQEITSVKFFISSTAGICCVTPRKGILPRPFLRIFFSFGGNRYLTLCLRKIACEWFRARVQIIL